MVVSDVALTPKQKAFADAYIANGGNATEAARAAGYKKPNPQGSENLVKPSVSAYIAERQAQIDSARIGTLKEIQEFRTRVLRGQEKDQFGIDISAGDRLKAATDLEKSLRIKEEHEQRSREAASRPYELPARVLGRAFVDINRRIVPNMSYVFEGGRGGLKSSYVSLKLIELLKNHPQMHACVVRKVAGTLRDSVYAQIKWAINELGLDDEFNCKVSPLEIVRKPTGQIIYFRGVDDPIKLKSIKPPFGYIGILWKEEKDQLAGPAEERNVNQSMLRGGAESYDFSSYNPPKSKSSWVNLAKLTPDPSRVIHHSSYLDAPPEWLGQKFLDDAAHLKEVNPAAYEHEYGGVPNGDGGNVFEYLDIRTITDEEIARMDRIFQGTDWGWYPDPFAFLRTYYDAARERIWIIDELYVNKQSNAQTGGELLQRGYGDYPITCDSAEMKSINDWRDMHLPARPAVKGPGSVEYGMKWLQSRTIVIDPARTPNAWREITRYEYERDKDGHVISGYPDRDNHTIDALRYAYEPLFTRRGTQA